MHEPSVPAPISLRAMRDSDWPAVSGIYAEGIAGGNSTFEQIVPEWSAWDAAHLPIVRLIAERNSDVVGWAALSPVSKRAVYRGVAEVSVYVANSAQSAGVGRQLLDETIKLSEASGIWTLQGGIFPENIASLRLFESRGFRRVGVREKIGQMNGKWRDTVLVERRSALR